MDLLELDNWMEGSQTLIMKIVHIMTDKSLPSPELVEKVKILYEERVDDVRFLIPVLTGLSKNEIIQTLPKLIQQNVAVVKEVFIRLLNTVSYVLLFWTASFKKYEATFLVKYVRAKLKDFPVLCISSNQIRFCFSKEIALHF